MYDPRFRAVLNIYHTPLNPTFPSIFACLSGPGSKKSAAHQNQAESPSKHIVMTNLNLFRKKLNISACPVSSVLFTHVLRYPTHKFAVAASHMQKTLQLLLMRMLARVHQMILLTVTTPVTLRAARMRKKMVSLP